jgi:hypothetical protein
MSSSLRLLETLRHYPQPQDGSSDCLPPGDLFESPICNACYVVVVVVVVVVEIALSTIVIQFLTIFSCIPVQLF